MGVDLRETDSHETSGPTLQTGGPGPFVTYRVQSWPNGVHRVATSRRHRKGLPSHEIASLDEATVARRTQWTAFRSVWAPSRLGWWIAVLFAIGSSHFLLAALAATWPETIPIALRDAGRLGLIFFVGSLFFTSAAWLQWLESLNRDVADAHDENPKVWRWFGWHPRNLGCLACAIQLIGTIFFNFNTADGLLPDLTWGKQDLLIWTPNMLGSICFLTASYLAYAEVSHGVVSFDLRSVSWWIAVINLLGSLAFQGSALTSFVSPTPSSPEMLFWSTFLTAVGALCFLIGAYLLVVELHDTD